MRVIVLYIFFAGASRRNSDSPDYEGASPVAERTIQVRYTCYLNNRHFR